MRRRTQKPTERMRRRTGDLQRVQNCETNREKQNNHNSQFCRVSKCSGHATGDQRSFAAVANVLCQGFQAANWSGAHSSECVFIRRHVRRGNHNATTRVLHPKSKFPVPSFQFPVPNSLPKSQRLAIEAENLARCIFKHQTQHTSHIAAPL